MLETAAATNAADLPFWLQERFQELCRLQRESRLAHAYLLQGQPGLGKRRLAERFAHYLLCDESADKAPCGRCSSCLLLAAGTHPTLRVLSPEEEGKQIRIEQIRDSLDFMTRTSMSGKRKILVIDPAEALNVNAANALLKNLEEPGAGTLLLLISHRPGLLLPTIRSRCQSLKFRAPDTQAALQWLQGASPDPDMDAGALLRLANGAPLRALALADSDAMARREHLHALLRQLHDGETDSLAAAASCAKVNIADCVESLLLATAELLRRVQGGRGERLSSQELERLAAGLSDVEGTRALHRYQAELMQAGRAISSPTNPNPQLLLESLFHQWCVCMLNKSNRSKP